METQQKRLHRLKRYWQRQARSAWGADYQPANRATRNEAPSRSRPTILCKKNKIGRELHAMSGQELAGILLAIYFPQLFDLNEQRILYPSAMTHPLFGHPQFPGMQLPPFKGTLAVAEALGYLQWHATVSWRSESGEQHDAPMPFVGDLLLFLVDGRGPYCLNWSIKKSAEDFSRPGPADLPIRNPERAQAKAIARHAIEVGYYNDPEIRTVSLAGDSLDPQMISNLLQCFSWQARKSFVSETLERKALTVLQSSANHSSDTPTEIARHFLLRHRLWPEIFNSLMYSLIWSRQLRVDLFQPILRDRPLVSESRDVLSVHGNLFGREG
ncbi:hypothetical protein [Nevskia soli]|uniref:hypothetical protein n=1 Tax=Nevskia soli TaxID=418856 RepID=UPI0004A6C506|nr:hypothetical protein [Nevskia soli]